MTFEEYIDDLEERCVSEYIIDEFIFHDFWSQVAIAVCIQEMPQALNGVCAWTAFLRTSLPHDDPRTPKW